MRLNLPNSLTIVRIFLAPLLVVVLLTPYTEHWFGVSSYVLAIGIFLVAIAASPFVLIINSVLAFQNQQNRAECFKRGMIVPGLVMMVAFLYQLGLIDALF